MVSNSYNEKAAASCGNALAPETPICAQISALESALRRIDNAIGRAETKLAPTIHNIPQPCSGTEKMPGFMGSPMAGTLNGLATMADNLNERLNSLLNMCEI